MAIASTASLLCLYAFHTSPNSPKITLIQFPSEIPADGTPVSGQVSFEDHDADVKRIHFSVVKGDRKALELESFAFDPKVAGVHSGWIPFSLACSKPQQVTFMVTLIDEAGHMSAGTAFSFKCV